MRILHYADQHVREKDIEEAIKCLDFVRDTAIKENVNLIISAGDWFDSRDVKMESPAAKLVLQHICEMADIAPVAIVTGTNSHDGSAPEILRYAKGTHDVFVATRPVQVHLEDGFFFDRPAGDRESECVVTLIPQPTKQFFQTESGIKQADQEIGAAMSSMLAGFGAQASNYNAPHVLAYHGSVSGATLSNGQVRTGMDIEISKGQLRLAGADLTLCGHIHFQQDLGDNIFYSGSIYANNYGENHIHGFYIHEISEAAE